MPLEFSPVGTAGPDMSDPAVIAEQCRTLAAGLRQEATASQRGTALSGHPNPDYFFNRCADLLVFLGEKFTAIADKTPKPAPETPQDGTTAPTPPSDPPKPAQGARRN
jgi:hypothetical protein